MKTTFITARIDAPEGPVVCEQQAAVPWWSFTKTALATAALRLVSQGQWKLDEPFEGRPYTLRQLLQHRAGVPDYGSLPSYHEAVRRGEKPWDVGKLLEQVKPDRLEFEPGQGWRYSNVGYLFVRQKIEEKTGRDIGSALKQLVFEELGLTSARVVTTAEDLADTAWGNKSGYDPGWVYHGLLVGTADDAVRFLHRLILGDVLPDEILAEMINPFRLGGPLPNRPWETTGYGLGLMIPRFTSAGSTLGHSGAGPNSVSAVYHFDDLSGPRTIAAFAEGQEEGLTEHEVVRLAAL
jgi:CubicO group peptidase (beta-lactamase class C family)